MQPVESPRLARRGRLANRDQLGVRGRIRGRLALVVAAPDHGAVSVDHDRADRDVAGAVGEPRLVEGKPHRSDVG